MNQTVELLRRTRELLADVQIALTTQAIIDQAKARAEAGGGQKPRKRDIKRAIKTKLNGGGK